MSLPAKLKNFNLFNDGESFLGLVPELTLPKLSRKMEEYCAAGMTGPIEVDFGNEAITLEWTAGGILKHALKQYGNARHNGVQLRFAGAYQNDDTGAVTAVEIVVRGRHKEIDFGNAKITEDTAHKFTTACSYYKLMIDGEDIIELDFINGTETIGGTDNSAIRTALGL
jgi:P2 family phage contractile tail tube protein